MIRFAIIEVADGLMVVDVPSGQDPNDVAIRHGGVLADPGPYPTFEAASDALIELQAEDEEE